MKKRLNIEGVTNELKGGSAFFPGYKRDETTQHPESHIASPPAQHHEPVTQSSPLSDNDNAHQTPIHKSPRNNTQARYREIAKQNTRVSSSQDNQSIPERANVPTPARPNGKRIITRNSFETYEDQMDALRKLSFKEKMEGKIGSMSKMVRDAIDEYLEKRSSEI